LAGVYISSWVELGIVEVFSFYAVSSLIGLLVVFTMLGKIYGKICLNWDWLFIKKRLLDALPIEISFVLFYLFIRVDGIVIYNKLGEEVSGFYQVCVSLVFMIITTLLVLLNASFPLMSQRVNKNNLRQAGIFNLLLCFTIGVIIYLAFYGYGDRIITGIYGDKYIKSSLIMRWYGLFIPSVMGLNFMNYYFVVIGKQRVLIKLYGLAVLLLPIVFVGVYLRGVYGAAFGVSLSSFLTFCYGFYLVSSTDKLAEKPMDKYPLNI
jgi:O-antigen/teichoic acid export membrane protein